MCCMSSWSGVIWIVALHDDFAPEYDELPENVQDELLVEKADRRFDEHVGRIKNQKKKGK